ncbi:MAG: TrkA family potassium uptake protein [Clostridium sp.]|jgi:trk system potassium uptake protein TrkA|uniref:potassium channel family protein n=1 Tax=Clostridium sp. TaxID=1506 RepID=UPI0025B81AA2|nr:TrkA family potassium uptake protein [Clostridium sp.]MCH3964251.1 TrkA family potassium uptake protein [Clostridium sp.]MCI1715431.1 TrkA family potassium uptake protein [Clostridium sp.]MCI1799778.1 TrkA family potassium uptake protein [Clostridium sp.]MCI1813614.1 TrkA family potassium uptake protein [Clostridium sp.]MCI1870595.1 TrkA family potassium uptake protein [Clostridium sp.]
MKKKQYLVIGLGRFGKSMAKTLYELGNDVLAVDSREDNVQNISHYSTEAVQTDATEEENLKAIGAGNFDVAVIGIGNDIQSSVIVTLLLKEMGLKYVIAKANTELHAKILYKIGADKVVFPEKDTAIRVAHNLVSSSILDFIELSSEYRLTEILCMKEWIGKDLSSLDIRQRYGINIIAVKRNREINVSPSSDFVLLEGDTIIAIGGQKEIEKLERHF